jgi:hypothetical protein
MVVCPSGLGAPDMSGRAYVPDIVIGSIVLDASTSYNTAGVNVTPEVPYAEPAADH